jgi:hypothetical protein
MMAQKFGNSRWVREGWLDNRRGGCVVGRITFAAIGAVDLILAGNCRGELAGKAFRFRNGRFEDDDLAAHVLGDLDVPQIGTVNLISFDPHPNLTPHPYIEWFSARGEHYRIELDPADAWVLSDREAAELDAHSDALRQMLTVNDVRPKKDDDSEWV